MVLFAAGVRSAHGSAWSGALHGLAIAAVAVVAHAVLRMFRSLCPDVMRGLLAAAAAAFAYWSPGSFSQVVVIAVGAIVGGLFLRIPAPTDATDVPLLVSRRAAAAAVVLFGALFLFLDLSPFALLRAFYRTGSLVFGGGHVVLPLLEQAVVRPGWVGEADFLAGYGAAQAIPGPLFTFAAYLGYVARTAPGGVSGAALCILALFLPGLLLATAAVPFWEQLRRRSRTRALLAGVNAAVVGLLISALAHAAASSGMRTLFDAVFVTGVFLLLLWDRFPVVLIVLTAAGVSAFRAVIG